MPLIPTLYADDGSVRVTVVSGTSLTGLYAPDGSMNIYLNQDSGVANGNYHPCGAMCCTLISATPTTPVSYYAPDGSTNFTVMPLRIPGIMAVTVVGGSLLMSTTAGVAASLDSNFLKNYTVITTAAPTAATTPYSVVRASSGLAETKSGNWITFNSNEARVTDKGLLIEESRTNSIRNSSFQGAVVGGGPLTITNWQNNITDGLTSVITGKGVEHGLDYVDIRVSGTTVVGGIQCYFNEQAQVFTAALPGQTWSHSCFFKLLSGTYPFIAGLLIGFYPFKADGVTPGTGVFNTTTQATVNANPGILRRVAYSGILAQADVGFILPRILFGNSPAAGTAVDYTMRWYAPQLELTSVPSQVATATVVSGGTGYTNGDVLTVVGGTGTAATLTVTGNTAGVITTVSVTTPGNYTVFPGPAATVSGGTGTGATFDLIATQQAGNPGTYTSPIRTTGVVATRSADVIKLTGTDLTSWYNNTQVTVLAQFNSSTPHGALGVICGFANEASPSFSDCFYFPITFTPTVTFSLLSASVAQTSFPQGAVDLNTPGQRSIAALTQNNMSLYQKKSGVLSNDFVGNMPVPAMTRFGLGYAVWTGGGAFFNNYIERVVVWNTKLSDADITEIGNRRL